MFSYEYNKESAKAGEVLILIVVEDGLVRWRKSCNETTDLVLILVVMEDGLVPALSWAKLFRSQVLILVVMEDGLVRDGGEYVVAKLICLNPCCDGRWPRTAMRQLKKPEQDVKS